MVSPWLLLIPGAAAVYSAVKPSAPALPAAPPRPRPVVPVPEIAPGVPATPKTVAYAEAVAAVGRVGKGPGSVAVFNGVTRWTASQAQGQPTYPILSEKDLPAPPPGYIWRASTKNSDMSRSAYTINYWELGSPPPAAFVPSTTLTPTMTAAPVAPTPRPIGSEIPDTPKTRAYRDALLLKEQAEAQAQGMVVAAVMYYVPGEALSQSDLPPASPGFQWVRRELAVKMNAPAASMWQYQKVAAAVTDAERLARQQASVAAQQQAQIDSYVKMNACFDRSILASHGWVTVTDEVWNALKAKGWTEYPATSGPFAAYSHGPVLCPPGKRPGIF